MCKNDESVKENHATNMQRFIVLLYYLFYILYSFSVHSVYMGHVAWIKTNERTNERRNEQTIN